MKDYEVVVNTDGQWNFCTLTFNSGAATATANTNNLLIIIRSQTANAAINVTQIQFEKGSEVTDFERVDPALQLMRCQRYYEVGSAELTFVSPTSGGAGYRFPFSVSKRDVPAMSYTETTANNVTSQTIETPTIGSFRYAANATTADVQSKWQIDWVADSEL